MKQSNSFSRSSTMSTVFFISDLVLAIAYHLTSQTDVSALNRCNQLLRDTTVPLLYRDIDFSVFKAESIAKALEKNPLFSKYCRRLSISIKGHPMKSQEPAFEHWIDGPSQALRKKFLSDIEYVAHQCAVHSNLTHFSCDLKSNFPLLSVWKMDDLQLPKSLLMCNGTIRSFHYSMICPSDFNLVSECP